jgi:hypothetical protein
MKGLRIVIATLTAALALSACGSNSNLDVEKQVPVEPPFYDNTAAPVEDDSGVTVSPQPSTGQPVTGQPVSGDAVTIGRF